MYLYRWGSHIIKEEEIDKIIAEKKEDARKLYLEHGSPLINEYGEECPDARYLSTCGVGICILDTEEEFDESMAKWKESLKKDYSMEVWHKRLAEVRVTKSEDDYKVAVDINVGLEPTWVTCFAVPQELQNWDPKKEV
jgi:hypothetical protein